MALWNPGNHLVRPHKGQPGTVPIPSDSKKRSGRCGRGAWTASVTAKAATEVFRF